MERAGLLVLVWCAGSLVGAEAGAVPLLDGFGGPSGYGTPDHCVAAGNDNSYGAGGATEPTAIDLGPAFPGGLSYFGRTVSRFYVNTNGNITFAAPLATPAPSPFPIEGQPMIAPWWADVDTRGGGSICFHLEPGRVVATWHDVRSFGARPTLRNSFQMILAWRPLCERPGDFDVEFRYERCEWAGGDPPGTPAQVGFDAGNRMNYVMLPQSRTPAVTDVCGTSNVPGGAPGLFRFQVRGGSASGCVGGGLPCVFPGQSGRCAAGVVGCVTSHVGTCLQVRPPRARGCDGFDNDCDGALDTDDELCGAGQVCDRAQCLDRCGPARQCPEGLACTSRGGCIDAACVDVACPPGQRCAGGRCVNLCEGNTCARGQRCFDGRCVDACAGVECEAPRVCDTDPLSPYNGQCIRRCECSTCRERLRCGVEGRCVADRPPTPDGGTLLDGGPFEDASADIGRGGGSRAGADGGCGCRTDGPVEPAGRALTSLALLTGLWVRRRRR